MPKIGRDQDARMCRSSSGQAMVEMALVAPLLLVLLLGAVDFGRVMQARVTALAATRAGASWGAGLLANANELLDPVYDVTTYCSGYGPSCNIEARSCAEAAGFPGYSGGPLLVTAKASYRDCANNYASSTNSAGGVCSPSATQSNPFLSVAWNHADGSAFTPGSGVTVKVGDRVSVTGTFCFNTLFPWPAVPRQVKFSSTSTYTVQP